MSEELSTAPLTEEALAEQLLQWRIKGYSDASIACGYKLPSAEVRRLIKKALKAVEFEDKKKIVRMELAKLDALEAVAMRAALNENGLHDRHATKTALSIAMRRAKLLGLDRPAKMELTGADGEPMQRVLFFLPTNGRDGEVPLSPDPAEGD